MKATGEQIERVRTTRDVVETAIALSKKTGTWVELLNVKETKRPKGASDASH